MTISRRSQLEMFGDGLDAEEKPTEPKPLGYRGGPLRPSGLLPTPTCSDARDGTIVRTGSNGHMGGRKNVNLNHLIENGWPLPHGEQMTLDGAAHQPLSLLPTPRASEIENGQETVSPSHLAGTHGWNIAAAVVDMRTGQSARTWAGFSPRDTRASRSATRGSDRGRMTPGTSGRSFIDCLRDFQPTSRIGWFSRMFVGTSAWGSTVCSMTWTASATPRGRSLYLLRVSARSTGGTGCGSSGAGPMWPTPTVQDGMNTAGASQFGRNTPPLNTAVASEPGQKLNPDFVERLMGFPPGWTVLSTSSDADLSTACR